MPKSSNQKLKLIYLMKILLERTDETHSITMPEMIDALAAYGISAERKSLYNDIENLRVYGLDIIGIQEDRTYSYHIGNRQFWPDIGIFPFFLHCTPPVHCHSPLRSLAGLLSSSTIIYRGFCSFIW